MKPFIVSFVLLSWNVSGRTVLCHELGTSMSWTISCRVPYFIQVRLSKRVFVAVMATKFLLCCNKITICEGA